MGVKVPRGAIPGARGCAISCAFAGNGANGPGTRVPPIRKIKIKKVEEQFARGQFSQPSTADETKILMRLGKLFFDYVRTPRYENKRKVKTYLLNKVSVKSCATLLFPCAQHIPV